MGRGGNVSGGRVVVVDDVSGKASVQEQLDDVLVARTGGKVEKGVAILVETEDDGRTMGEEDLERVKAVVEDGDHGGVALHDGLRKGVSAMFEKECDEVRVVLDDGPVERSVEFIVSDVDVSVSIEKQLDGLL